MQVRADSTFLQTCYSNLPTDIERAAVRKDEVGRLHTSRRKNLPSLLRGCIFAEKNSTTDWKISGGDGNVLQT